MSVEWIVTIVNPFMLFVDCADLNLNSGTILLCG